MSEKRFVSANKKQLDRSSITGLLKETTVTSRRYMRGETARKPKINQDRYIQSRRRAIKKPNINDKHINLTDFRRRNSSKMGGGDINMTAYRRERSKGMFNNGDVNMTELRRQRTIKFDSMEKIVAPYEKRLDRAINDFLTDENQDAGLQTGVLYSKSGLKGLDAVLDSYQKFKKLKDHRSTPQNKPGTRDKSGGVHDKSADSGQHTRREKPPQQKMQEKRAAYDKSRGQFIKEQAQKIGSAIKEAVAKIGHAIFEFVAANASTIGIVLLVILGILLIVLSVSAIVNVVSVSYLSEDVDLIKTSEYLTRLDTDLLYEIGTIEIKPEYTERPPDKKIEEFRYFAGNSGEQLSNYMDVYCELIHTDPLDVLPYLTVTKEDFTFDEVSGFLNSTHSSLYSYTEEEIIEIEQKEEPVLDLDGNPIYDPEGNPVTETKEIEHHFVIVKVFAGKFMDTVTPLTEEQQELYDLIRERNGNRPNFGNPFKTGDWRDKITSLYGWRLDPFTMYDPEEIHTQFHDGLDLAMPTGTPIYAVGGGTVSTGSDGTYGNYVIVTNGSTSIRYAHCSTISVSNGAKVKTGQEIAKVGNTGNSTGAHLHINIAMKGEKRNPLIDLSID